MANIKSKEIRDSRDVHDLTFYKFAIESLPVAVMTVDPELRITGFNSSAEEITGYSKKETLGRDCSEILRSELCRTRKERGSLDHLFILVVFGDLVGLPLLPPYYSMRLLPFIVPFIETWKRSLLREKDSTDFMSAHV